MLSPLLPGAQALAALNRYRRVRRSAIAAAIPTANTHLGFVSAPGDRPTANAPRFKPATVTTAATAPKEGWVWSPAARETISPTAAPARIGIRIPNQPGIPIPQNAPTNPEIASPPPPASRYCRGFPNRTRKGCRAQLGHLMPTGVSRIHLVQIGESQEEHRTRVPRRGWLMQKSSSSPMKEAYRPADTKRMGRRAL
jgi:hypothetical protein